MATSALMLGVYTIVKAVDHGWGSAHGARTVLLPGLAALVAGLATLATARTNGLLEDGDAAPAALTGGYHLAFAVAAAALVAAIVVAATVLRPESAAQREAQQAATETAYSEAA